MYKDLKVKHVYIVVTLYYILHYIIRYIPCVRNVFGFFALTFVTPRGFVDLFKYSAVS